MAASNGKRVRQAVVLAGGLGTRLGQLTQVAPKPLLPIAGRPFLAYVFDWLARSGVEEIVVSTGYLPEAFGELLVQVWNDPYGNPIRIREARENVRAGTAGALALMADRLDQRFLLLNGDTFFDCDLASVITKSESLPPGAMLMTVREVDNAGRYGRVEIDEGGLVRRFAEKGDVGGGYINAGVSVLDRTILDLIDAVPCSLETDVYPRVVESGWLYASKQSGYFIDIGLPDTYERASRELPVCATKPAVFFDRDGVLNKDDGHTFHPSDLKFVEGAVEAIGVARKAGYLTVVVTNQAGVAKGHYDEAAVETFHRYMNSRMRERGAWIDAFYYCPYHPEGSVAAYRQAHPERKPEPGMILRAIRELSIDRSRSFLIGDKESDLEAARRAGIRGYLYSSGGVDELVGRILALAEK